MAAVPKASVVDETQRRTSRRCPPPPTSTTTTTPSRDNNNNATTIAIDDTQRSYRSTRVVRARPGGCRAPLLSADDDRTGSDEDRQSAEDVRIGRRQSKETTASAETDAVIVREWSKRKRTKPATTPTTPGHTPRFSSLADDGHFEYDTQFKDWLEDRKYEEKTTVADFFQGLGKCLLAFLYICCPPTPEMIFRKLAFHPPRKGFNYKIRDRAKMRLVDKIQEVSSDNVEIVLLAPKWTFQTYCDVITSMTKAFIVQTSRGNQLLCAQFVVGNNAAFRRASDMVILFVQPNSTDLGHFMLAFTNDVPFFPAELGVDVYTFDYSGYGYSSGKPSEKNMYADIRAVYAYLRKNRPTAKIVLYAYSIGTAVALDLAATRPQNLLGIVLVAPFTSALRAFCNKPSKPKSCCLDRFRSIDKANAIEVPVLILHGTRDDLIPHVHSKYLHKMLKHALPPVYVEGADHSDILSAHGAQVYRAINCFLNSLETTEGVVVGTTGATTTTTATTPHSN